MAAEFNEFLRSYYARDKIFHKHSRRNVVAIVNYYDRIMLSVR